MTNGNDPNGQSAASVQNLSPENLGLVEFLCPEFVMGWAAVSADGTPARVQAKIADTVIALAESAMPRPDLVWESPFGSMNARAFIMTFNPPLTIGVLNQVSVSIAGADTALQRLPDFEVHSDPPKRIFVLGSPRSGTSQMGASLVKALKLPWTGEAHVGPLFAAAAASLGGDANSPSDFVKAIHNWNYRGIAIEAARRAYFAMHTSPSFLDKTPGIAMVKAAPFLIECFPGAKIIFMLRNPVANVSSRLAKFGGVFAEHCMDWAATMETWANVREELPSWLEIRQEEMARNPTLVAEQLANYLGRGDLQPGILRSLSSEFLERTGAGLEKTLLSDSGWTQSEMNTFREICEPMAELFNYPLQRFSASST